MKLVIIDNYDSFTYNLEQYFLELGANTQVVRNDQVSCEELSLLRPSHLVISPGPCTPNESGVSLQAIEFYAGHIPILGVCLGHQAIAQMFGAKITQARQVMHGKTSLIQHRDQGIFSGLSNPLQATRYHSLIVEPENLPEVLEITAWTDTVGGGFEYIMGLQHKELPIYGVQFHPESILTEQGHQLLNNFLQQE